MNNERKLKEIWFLIVFVAFAGKSQTLIVSGLEPETVSIRLKSGILTPRLRASDSTCKSHVLVYIN